MKFRIPMRLLVIVFMLLSLSCTSTSEVPDPATAADVTPAIDGEEYLELIEKYTQNEKRYSGFHLAYEADITILNSRVRTAMIQQKAQFLNWSLEKARQERSEALSDMSTYATYFISYFAPDDDYNDLEKPDSIWKIYLHFNGTRYEGKVQKVEKKLIELKALFPHHDRWSTAYEVTFPIPMTAVEESTSTITMTSSLGESRFVFRPVLGGNFY